VVQFRDGGGGLVDATVLLVVDVPRDIVLLLGIGYDLLAL
jgi:hypothetical protein